MKKVIFAVVTAVALSGALGAASAYENSKKSAQTEGCSCTDCSCESCTCTGCGNDCSGDTGCCDSGGCESDCCAN